MEGEEGGHRWKERREGIDGRRGGGHRWKERREGIDERTLSLLCLPRRHDDDDELMLNVLRCHLTY